MTPQAPLVATILPPREGFGPGNAGAIGMIVQRFAQTPGFRCAVFGGPQARSFDDVAFHGVRPAWWFPGNINLRYGAALLGPLRRIRPALVEVYNRPELALFLARRLRCPVLMFLQNDPQAMRQARTPAQRRVLLQRLGGVVAASAWLRDRMHDGVEQPARPAAVLPNCLDLSLLPPAGEREKLIVFAGRIVAEKGPDAFVQACAQTLPQLPGWRAEMLGADRFGADSPETAFARKVRAEAEAAGVRMAGYCEHDAVLAAMSRAAIVVVPSRWQEPFGLVALEAIACGAALVCAPNGGLPEIAGDAAVYADPDAPGALADAILRLARDAGLRGKLAEAGRARARRFDRARVAGELATLRQHVLGRSVLQS